MRAAFFDIDGTLTKDRTWKGFLDYFKQHRLRRGTHALFLGVHYPLYFLYKLHLISMTKFRGAWAADMAWYVRSYTLERAQEVWDWTVERFLNKHWREDICALLQNHQRAGEPVILVSSGPGPLIQRIAREFGTEHAIGTSLELVDGRYTGRSLPPVCIDQHKATLARAYLRERCLEIDLARSYAYADAISDLPLLEMVGNPVAVYPERSLREIAEEREWLILPG